MPGEDDNTTVIDITKGYGASGNASLLFKGQSKDYLIFSERFKCVLGVYGLDGVLVEGHTDANNAAKKKKVYQLLVNAIDDESFKLIFTEAKDDGKKALEILSDRYLGSKSDLEVELLTELFDVKIHNNEDHIKFINRIDLIKSQLESNNIKLPDKAFTVLALRGLAGNKYEQFRSSVKVRKDWPLWAEFKSLIKVHESSLFSAENLSESDIVLNTNVNRYKTSASGNKNKTKSNVECNYCKKVGHTFKQCFKRKAKMKHEKHSANTVSAGSPEGPDKSFFFKCEVLCGPIKSNEIPDSLLIDSGATSHIISDGKSFISFDKDYDPTDHFVELADGTRTNGMIKGKGNATFNITDSSGITRKIILKEALYIPSYSLNIFSVKKAADQGATFSLSDKGCSMVASNGVMFPITCVNNLYYMYMVKPTTVESSTQNSTLIAGCQNVISDSSTESIDLAISTKCDTHSVDTWHMIMGHCNIKDIFNLQKVVNGMNISNKIVSDCSTCTQGKMFEPMSRVPDERATAAFEFVHTDLNGPVSPVSKEGFKYLISFVDDYTGNIAVYFLKRKSDTIAATQRFLADIAPYGKLKRLRSDNGTEYTSESFESLMINNQIRHEFSSPYSPHQNGTAERSFRTLFDMARCLIIEANLPKTWWPHALQTSAYIRNRCFNHRLGITAYEAVTGKKPDLSSMHIFGSICYAYVLENGKLDPRSEEGIFLGYDKYSPAYIVYLPKSKTFRKIRCVKFTDKFAQPKPILQSESQQVPSVVGLPLPDVGPLELQDTGDTQNVEVRRNPPRDRKKPKRYDDTVANLSVDYCYRCAAIPRSYKEAISSDESCYWKKAMQKEIDSLRENNTFELVPWPDDQTVISGRWLFAYKLHPHGDENHKARYVCKGYEQVFEVDYLETFSATPRRTTIRIVIQKAKQENMIVHQMDFSTAYLNADLDCDVFVKQPDGFVEDPNCVWKLNKALYGLKQSGRCWNNHLNKFLTAQGFTRSMSDPCLYTFFDGNNTVNLIVWVDDLLIAASNIEIMNKIKGLLSQHYKMKDLRVLIYFLGIQFQFNKTSIVMQQSEYVDKLLERFNMNDCKTKPTPCPLGINKELGNNSELLEDNTLYREIVGSLIYLMTNTRPDISYVVTLLGQYMSKPTFAHLSLAKHVLRYLKGTKSLGLNFVKSDSGLEMFGYCDSDWGGSLDRKSISGYCFMLHKNGPLVSWKSCKQNVVALSSCEAEYVALTSAFKEARFLRQLVSDINGCTKQSIRLFADNQGAIALAKNPVHHQRSKHIDIRYHFIRLDVEEGVVILEYVPTNENIADLFTKPLSGFKFNDFASIRGPRV